MKKSVSETYCFRCEKQLLTDRERFGPICPDCFRRLCRRDLLAQAADRRRLIAVIPALCPHDENCKFDRNPPRFFNVMVLNERLEPVRIEGPYPLRIARREAQEIQEKIDRRKGRGKGRRDER